jgi:hypothetical protein
MRHASLARDTGFLPRDTSFGLLTPLTPRYNTCHRIGLLPATIGFNTQAAHCDFLASYQDIDRLESRLAQHLALANNDFSRGYEAKHRSLSNPREFLHSRTNVFAFCWTDRDVFSSYTIGTSTVLDLATPLNCESTLLVLGYETGHLFLSNLRGFSRSRMGTFTTPGRIRIFLS